MTGPGDPRADPSGPPIVPGDRTVGPGDPLIVPDDRTMGPDGPLADLGARTVDLALAYGDRAAALRWPVDPLR